MKTTRYNNFTGRSFRLHASHPARLAKERPLTDEQKAFMALPEREKDTVRTAQQIAYSRVWAERWESKGNAKRAADRRAEEGNIIQNAKNFKIKIPSEDMIVAEMANVRARLAEADRKRAEEEAELADE